MVGIAATFAKLVYVGLQMSCKIGRRGAIWRGMSFQPPPIVFERTRTHRQAEGKEHTDAAFGIRPG